MTRLKNRSGMALAVALGAIVVIGLLASGVFFLSTQQYRMGRSTVTSEKAFRTAELGLQAVYDTMTRPGNKGAGRIGGWQVGADDVVVSNTTAGLDSVHLTKVSATTYLLQSVAYTGASSANEQSRRVTSQLFRLTFPNFNFYGALTARAGIKIGGSSYINGFDSNPGAWTGCPPSSGNKPGVVVSPGTTINFSGCNGLKCIDGSPQDTISLAAAADTTNYFKFGDLDWTALANMADLKLTASDVGSPSPVVSNGACVTGMTQKNNWGDPTHAAGHPCQDYFPIIYVSGTSSTVKLTGGSGQGILLIDGDLSIQGGFEFYGPVIVRGHLDTAGTGGHLNGGVMAADVNLESSTVLGNAVINYSSCTVAKAIQGTGKALPIKDRAWAQLF